MPLLKRVRVLAAKAETVPGDIEALTATEAAFHVFDTLIQPAIDYEERAKQGGFARLPSQRGGHQGKCTFSTHFYGASVQPAGMATFLPAVGMGFQPSSCLVPMNYYQLDPLPAEAAGTTQTTLTLGSYQNGRRKRIFGAMGNMKATFPAGKLALAEFEFTGKWMTPDDIAILAPTYPTLTPLRVVSATFTIGAYGAFKLAEATLDLANKIYLREDANDATGFSSAVISDRLPIVTMNPESTTVAVKDLYGEWLASAEANLSLVLTNGTDTCTITASDLQFIGPEEADRNGLEVDQVNCQLNTDDLKFAFA